MISVNNRVTCRRARIARYRRLLATDLTEVERRYIERRLAEEGAGSPAFVSSAATAANFSRGMEAATASW